MTISLWLHELQEGWQLLCSGDAVHQCWLRALWSPPLPQGMKTALDAWLPNHYVKWTPHATLVWLCCLTIYVSCLQELQEATAAPECLAFAMTMLCMDAEFEGQAAALLRTAFELISARDFCLCEL